MKMSELSAATDVPIATIKFYIREGLVHPGARTSRTTAVYDDSHVSRIRLTRALTEHGGLPLARVKDVLDLIEAPPQRHDDLLLTSQRALINALASGNSALSCSVDEQVDVSRARTWATAHGWTLPGGDDAALRYLQRAWEACVEAGINIEEDTLDAYAEGMDKVADGDLQAVGEDAAEAVQDVIVGTVMTRQVLSALRLLAQREALQRMLNGADQARADESAKTASDQD